jgi:hypothetical protein
MTGILADGCQAPSDNAWRVTGGSGGYGVLGICNGGLYWDFELVGAFFHGGAWGAPVAIENGIYKAGYFSGLAADGAGFTAIWSQTHESQTDDPIAHKLYMRTGL